MKKEDRYQKNEVFYEDADYQQDYRVDPLTTRDKIKSEVQEIERIREEREQKRIEDQKRKADEDSAELARLREIHAGVGSSGSSPQPGSGMADPRNA